MTNYQKETNKLASKFQKKFDSLQFKFNAELRSINVKSKKLTTTADSNLLWNKKYADKHAKLMQEYKREQINIWKKHH